MGFLSSPRNGLLLHLRRFSTALSPPPSISLSSAKSKLRSELDPDKALAIFSSISEPSSSSTTPVSFSYALDLTVKRLFKSRRFADIETLIESQKTHNPFISQEPFLSSLILSYGRAAMLDHAIRTFADMDRLGTPRSSASFNALLSACIRSQNLNRVAELFAEFPSKYGISPDKMSYGILIKSQCELGAPTPEIAIGTLKEMKEKNVEITTIAYTTILDALYTKSKIEEAEKIWGEMRRKGCCLDVGAYNVKLKHTHQGNPEEVLKLIKEMGASGVMPDIISYNYLLKFYFANNQVEEAKKVYKCLWELRCLPNAWTFSIMIHNLCENGEFDTALRVCKASVKRNKIPDFRTVRSLLEGLVKNTMKIRDAKALIDMVRKRCPKRFSTEWSNVEMELGLKGAEKGAAAGAAAAA